MRQFTRLAVALWLLGSSPSGRVAADAGVARATGVRAVADASVARKATVRVAKDAAGVSETRARAADAGKASSGAAEAGVAGKASAGGAVAGVASKASARAADAGVANREGAERELAAVLSQLAETEALSARFREEKRMSLLAQPLLSEGALHYEKPRSLARHTERPRKSSLLLEKDVVSFGDAQHSESIGLSAQPALRVLVETFVSVLAGDRAALERVADVALEPLEGGGFRIRVTPKDAGLKRLVRTMSFEGKGALLSRMELLDANGDSTVTTFSDVKLRKHFSAAERARLFRIGG